MEAGIYTGVERGRRPAGNADPSVATSRFWVILASLGQPFPALRMPSRAAVLAPCDGKETVLKFEVIDIRRFEAQDFSALLEAESRAWRTGLRWDFAASARVISACMQEKRLPGYALVLEGKIGGYCFFFYDGEKGLIGDLFVNSAFAGVSEALGLLEHVLETLLGTPGLRRVEAQLPHFSFDELESTFSACHFQGYRRRFMVACLGDQSQPAADSTAEVAAGTQKGHTHPDEFMVMPWERKHDREAAELLYNTYRHHVDAMINDQYGSVSGAIRLVENIAHHQGCGEYLPQVSRVAIHRASQTLAGILAVTTVRPRTAHIPQVAVASPFQGGGLGDSLMRSAFHDLAKQGYQEVSLTVTDANAGAVRFYERLGFETFRPFGAFVFDRP